MDKVDKLLVAFLVIFIGTLIITGVTLSYNAVVFKTECKQKGGIPVEGYCVKEVIMVR